MADEIEDLKRLPPAERLKKLKEIEEKRKQEISEAEELIRESMLEIDHVEERKEFPAPETKAESISHLVTRESKDLFKTKRFANGEDAAEEAPAEEPSQRDLGKHVEEEAEERKSTEEEGKGIQYGDAIEEARSKENPVYAESKEQIYEQSKIDEAYARAEEEERVTAPGATKPHETYKKEKEFKGGAY